MKKNLNIIGLMVIPPNDNNPEKYFKSLNELNRSLALKELSMGMSADYMMAVDHGSTFVRVGSSILERDLNFCTWIYFFYKFF